MASEYAKRLAERTERLARIEAELIQFCCECKHVDCRHGECESLVQKRRELKGLPRGGTKRGAKYHGKNPQQFTCNGVTMTLSEWGKYLGVNSETLRHRLHMGLSIEEAFYTPVGGLRQ